MADITGVWDCISSTPMGDQKSVMDLRCEGGEVTVECDRFSGGVGGILGKSDMQGVRRPA